MRSQGLLVWVAVSVGCFLARGHAYRDDVFLSRPHMRKIPTLAVLAQPQDTDGDGRGVLHDASDGEYIIVDSKGDAEAAIVVTRDAEKVTAPSNIRSIFEWMTSYMNKKKIKLSPNEGQSYAPYQSGFAAHQQPQYPPTHQPTNAQQYYPYYSHSYIPYGFSQNNIQSTQGQNDLGYQTGMYTLYPHGSLDDGANPSKKKKVKLGANTTPTGEPWPPVAKPPSGGGWPLGKTSLWPPVAQPSSGGGWPLGKTSAYGYPALPSFEVVGMRPSGHSQRANPWERTATPYIVVSGYPEYQNMLWSPAPPVYGGYQSTYKDDDERLSEYLLAKFAKFSQFRPEFAVGKERNKPGYERQQSSMGFRTGGQGQEQGQRKAEPFPQYYALEEVVLSPREGSKFNIDKRNADHLEQRFDPTAQKSLTADALRAIVGYSRAPLADAVEGRDDAYEDVYGRYMGFRSVYGPWQDSRMFERRDLHYGQPWLESFQYQPPVMEYDF